MPKSVRGVKDVLGKVLIAGLSTLAAVPLSLQAVQAGGFAIREQSAEFQGSAFAGHAAGGAGLSSMFWNPATLTLGKGFRSEYNISLIVPYSRDKSVLASIPGVGTDTGNIGRTAIVPTSYTSLQLTDSLWLGLGVNAPFGMKTKNRATAVTAIAGYKSEIVTININPVVAYRFNDHVSVAAGLQINYMEGDLSTTGNAALGIPATRVKGDDWGLGATVGLLLTPREGTRIGIGYRSRVRHTLKGHLLVTGLGTGSAAVKHTLPDMITVSLRQRLTERLDLLASYEWTNWSLFRTFTVVSSLPGSPFVTAYNWKDSHFISLGGEYAWSDSLTLRAGYAFEKSPVPDSTRGTRVPDNDRHWLSVGASWRPDDGLTLHAGYSHLFVKKGTANAAPLFVADYRQHVDIVAVSATIDTGRLFMKLTGE